MNITGKWKRYPTYKDSGVEWLGEIPEHWGLTRLKYVCSESAIYGANVSADNYKSEGIRFIRTSDIDDKGNLISDEAVYLDKSLVSEYLLNDGDILLSRSGTIGRSFLYNSKKHGECSYAGYLVRFVPNKFLFSRYAFYFTKSRQFRDWISISVIESTIGNVNGQKYANMPLTLPSIQEQSGIVNFLDLKTAEIDALIAKKERLIELLQEKRQALISHAVTKGLDPNVKMKDSGVEWLGEIPEHWEVKKLKYSMEFLDNLRIPLSAEERSYKEKIYPYYGASGIIDYVDDYIFDKDLILIGEDGANLYNRSTPLAFIASGKYWVNNHAHVLKPINGNLKYWVERLNSISYTPFITGSAQPKLTLESLANIYFASPSKSEQDKIAEFLDDVDKKYLKPIEALKKQIGVFREYRTALISAAVTGKIDVRSNQ